MNPILPDVRTNPRRWPGAMASVWLGLMLAAAPCPARAQDSVRSDWLRNPAMGNYKAYAEFKMARYAEAREVWETLAEVGNGDALFNLGILAEDGLGEPVNLAKAEQLYLSAAQAGNVKAQYRLGLLYSDGSRWPADLHKARVYLALAAAQGDREARARLQSLGQPVSDLSPFEQAEWLASAGRTTEAAAMYRALAADGHLVAVTRLAWMHEAGRGVTRDLDEAARLFQRAAEGGVADAQYALAVMYRTGRGRPRDDAWSRHWLRKAADQGHPAAQAAWATLQAASAQN